MNEQKKKPRFWKSLPKEDKKGIVRRLLELGYTCQAVGVALGSTKNAVVGYQHIHLGDLTDRGRGTLDIVPQELLAELLHTEWPLEGPGTGVVPEETPSAAGTDPTRTCVWPVPNGGSLKELKLCGRDAIPGGDLCEEHKRLAQNLARKR